jgi:hypothetical protein
MRLQRGDPDLGKGFRSLNDQVLVLAQDTFAETFFRKALGQGVGSLPLGDPLRIKAEKRVLRGKNESSSAQALAFRYTNRRASASPT